MSEHGRCGLRVLLLALVLGFGSVHAVAQDGSTWRVTGNYKNLLLGSKTLAGERFALDRNRLRVAVKGAIGEAATIDLQYDNELLFGDYLRTTEFQHQKDLAPPQYWSLQSDYLDRSLAYGSHQLYRATVSVAIGQTDIRFGRQRITWGNGRFWSPLDLLNPVTPITLDRSERLGVDAVLIEHRTGPLSRLAAVYAPDHDEGRTTRALLWHDNAGGTDYSVVLGRFRRDQVVGFDLAGQIGQAVVRAELARVRPPSGAGFNRALLGLDYAFANTLTVSAEVYRDGSGATDPALYDFNALATGQRQTAARRYLGVRTTYDVAPLVKWTGELVVNLVDRSRYLAPTITWSIRPDLDGSVGLQLFYGPGGSEFERFRSALYMQWQWFF